MLTFLVDHNILFKALKEGKVCIKQTVWVK